MDLVQTVRKEGSRGGRGDFKWEDVKLDAQRENYLGHSLMAPVGRWQQGKDLNWYAKADADGEQSEADRRREEIRKVKEAEEDAMAAALGLPPPSRNANMAPLGPSRGAQVKQETVEQDRKRPHDRRSDDRDRGDTRHRREDRRREDRYSAKRRRSRSPRGAQDDESTQREHRHRRRSRSPRHSHDHDRRRNDVSERYSDSRGRRSPERKRSLSPTWRKRRRGDLDSDSQATSASPPPFSRHKEQGHSRSDYKDRRRSRSPGRGHRERSDNYRRR